MVHSAHEGPGDFYQIAERLADITVFKYDRPSLQLLELITSLNGIKSATLWSILPNSEFAVAQERFGYRPDPRTQPNEYFCPISGSHIELFLSAEPFKNFTPFIIDDIKNLKEDHFFNTNEKISALCLTSSLMIPLNTSESICDSHFLNIYFDKSKIDPSALQSPIPIIAKKLAAIVMSRFEQRRGSTGRRFQEIASEAAGDVAKLASCVVSELLPWDISARRFFIFIPDGRGRIQYWQNQHPDGPVVLDGAGLKSIGAVLGALKTSNIESYWSTPGHVFTEILGGDSVLIAPIVSGTTKRTVGLLVACDSMQNLVRTEFETELVIPFSSQQSALLEDIAWRLSSLLDVFLFERERSYLTSNLAHEIYTPSIYIRNTAVRLMRKGLTLDKQSLAELSNIQHTADMQIAICDGIFMSLETLGGSRADSYDIHPIAIHASFLEWRRTLAPLCENYGLPYANIRIDVTVPPLNLDFRALQAVFFNLSVNALKYAGASQDDSRKFSLVISSKSYYSEDEQSFPPILRDRKGPSGITNRGFHVITFEDHGIGVPAEERASIFKKFYRVKKPKSIFRPGMGLGLAVARKISRDFYGELWLEHPYAPTRFSVAFPAFLDNDRFSFSSEWREVYLENPVD